LVITPATNQPVAIAKRAVKMFDAELQAKDIKPVFEANPSLQELEVDWMMLDPSRVLQILINLMTNAIKFTAASTKRIITVSVGVSRGPPSTVNTPHFQYVPIKISNADPTVGDDWGMGEVLYLRFKVQDTGCGLTPEEMQVLFKRFSQASPRTHAQYGGSGLGLYICRQLAELHGGQIGVASEAGVGSTFGFFIMARKCNPPGHIPLREVLPVAPDMGGDIALSQRVSSQAQDVASSSAAVAPLANEEAQKLNPKDLDILVVEDNLVNQKILVQQLKKVGSTVHVANDGLEALAFLEETHYCKKGGHKLSVVLMDLEMPNMNGLTCVSEIRKMEQEGKFDSHVPVIAVTANVRDGQIKSAMESGMDDVVSKPFRIPDLLVKIEVLLGALGAAEK
jgi:CheY-like chemotaxis protein